MRRKPLNPDSAQAEGVDYLLREFKALRTAKPATTGVAASAKAGPIDPDIFIASSTVRPEIQNNADFVCYGADDDLLIQAVFDWLEDNSYSESRVQLSGGTFYCAGPVDCGFNSLWGTGIDDTYLEFGNGARYNTSNPALTIKFGVHDLTVGVSATTAPCPAYGLHLEQRALAHNVDVTFYPTDPSATSLGAVSIARGEFASGRVYSSKTTTPAVYVWGTNRRNNMVTDSSIVGGEDGVLVATDNVIVHGNFISDTAQDGVSVAAAATRTLVNDNQIYTAGRHGIYVASTDGLNIALGNVIEAAGTDGIHLTSATSGDVIGPNLITGSGGVAVNDNGTGTVLISGDTGVLASVVKHDNFAQTGALTIGSGTVRYYTQTDRTITGVYAMVSGAPVTSPAVFDVNMDGATTIFTTQANRPEIAAAAFLSAVEVPDVTAWDAGSYLLIDVDAANSATDLILVVQYTEA